ncbi:MAG: AI-2E family transporter [Candidatus Peribacteraceae bacterium]|nr:AI-2E family transporter [Candidatus Peribacteraceae bacterium]MDD5075035.1 AI-2E family transporter [Candidatus Peribacteraceae bacterium]
MSSPTPSPKAFSSFRIIGKKAQRLLQRARKGLTQNTDAKERKTPLPSGKHEDEITVHLSLRSVIRATFTILAIIVGVWALYYIRETIILFLLATFVAVVIDPSVQAMQRIRIPRGVAVLIHFIVAIFLVLFLIISLIPIVADQLQQIALFIGAQVNLFLGDPRIHLPLLSADVNQRLTDLVQSTLQSLSIERFTDAISQVSQHLSGVAQGSWAFAKAIAGSVASFIVNFIVVLVLAFFMQLEKEKIIRWLRSFLSAPHRSYMDMKFELIHTKISQWARGEALLMFSIFSLTLIALLILKMPYALTLALLAGFCEFVPAVGPFFAAIPAVLIGVTQGGVMWGLVLVAVYYVIQWCENNLLVPLIMKRAVGLSPLAILFALMMGISFPDTIHPVVGVMLSIPMTTIIAIFLEDLRGHRERNA